MRQLSERHERWVRFITSEAIRERKPEILEVLKTLSEIEFQGIIGIFRPEIRIILNNFYYKELNWRHNDSR